MRRTFLAFLNVSHEMYDYKRIFWRGRIFTYRTRHTQCVERLFLGVLMTDFCFKNEAYTVCSVLVLPRGLCRIFTYRKRHTQCVARLFLRVAYVESLVIERGIHSVGSLLLRVV